MIPPLSQDLRTAAPPGARPTPRPPFAPPPCDVVTLDPAPPPSWRGVALASLAALSALTALSAGAAGGPPASVVLLDEFRNAEQPGVTTHGELVEAELRGSCTASPDTRAIGRVQVDLGASMQGWRKAAPAPWRTTSAPASSGRCRTRSVPCASSRPAW